MNLCLTSAVLPTSLTISRSVRISFCFCSSLSLCDGLPVCFPHMCVSLFPCEPISIIGLSLRRLRLGYLYSTPPYRACKKTPYTLISVERPNLQVTPLLMFEFAANCHLNDPRPATIWPCSSVGRVTVICSGGREVESHRGKRIFPFSVWAHCISFLELSLIRYHFGYLYSSSTYHM